MGKARGRQFLKTVHSLDAGIIGRQGEWHHAQQEGK
jgi:hypothetical protein